MSLETCDDWRRTCRVLCLRPDQLGDLLMTTPAIRARKERGSDRRTTLLRYSGGAAVGRLVPEVDEVLVYDSPWMKATALRADSGPDRERIARLGAEASDAAVIVTV